MKFAVEVSVILRRDHLTFRQILRHGADGFTSPPKEVMLRIFIALKILSRVSTRESWVQWQGR
jgi:hypothetical protein